MPGMDHAGIVTQNVVERLLKDEGKTKDDLGKGTVREARMGVEREIRGKYPEPAPQARLLLRLGA